jgi:dTDP-4-dehydrorhamnose reductase
MKVLVTGAGGQVGRELVDALAPHDVVACTHAQLDIGDRDAVLGAVTSLRPDAIAHCAAWTNVDGCESDHDRAFRDNAMANRYVMEAARRVGAYVVTLSTDYVFDGEKDTPYHEWDTPNPQSVYGESKLAGEFEIDPDCGVVRTSWVCGRHGSNMVKTILRLAAQPGPMRFVSDQRGSPTIVSDLVVALRSFVIDRLPGTWHVTNQGALTWYEFARVVLLAAGDDPGRVEAIKTGELEPPRPAARPANSELENRALRLAGRPLLPHYRDSLDALARELKDASR